MRSIKYVIPIYVCVYFSLLPVNYAVLLAREILRYFITKSFEDVGACKKTKLSEFVQCAVYILIYLLNWPKVPKHEVNKSFLWSWFLWNRHNIRRFRFYIKILHSFCTSTKSLIISIILLLILTFCEIVHCTS